MLPGSLSAPERAISGVKGAVSTNGNPLLFALYGGFHKIGDGFFLLTNAKAFDFCIEQVLARLKCLNRPLGNLNFAHRY